MRGKVIGTEKTERKRELQRDRGRDYFWQDSVANELAPTCGSPALLLDVVLVSSRERTPLPRDSFY